MLLFMFFVATAVAALPVPTPLLPARGWNSYDGFACTFNESLAHQQATHLAPFVAPGGFEYFVIDEGWAEDSNGFILDGYGRPTYNTALYPQGMAALSAYLNGMGLHLGLWMIRGIPMAAVTAKLPILGTNFTAADIAMPEFKCVWKTDVYGINMSHPAGQAYYNSVVSLYNSWGVKYLKADCEFGQRDMVNPNEIFGVSNAVTRANTEIRLGLSPGVNALVSEAMLIHRAVNGYRITDDLWDCWSPNAGPCLPYDGITVMTSLDRLVNFSSMIGAAGLGDNGCSYPDPDSFPFGLMRLGTDTSRISKITPQQAQFMYTMWSITQSVFVLGGDLTYMPSYLSSLYSNSDLRDVHQNGTAARVIAYNSTVVVWRSGHRTNPGVVHLGVFAYDPVGNATWAVNYTFTYASVGALKNTEQMNVYCTVMRRSLGTWRKREAWVVQTSANTGIVLKLSPF